MMGAVVLLSFARVIQVDFVVSWLISLLVWYCIACPFTEMFENRATPPPPTRVPGS